MKARQAKLSNNAMKTLQKIHQAQAANLKYETFERMHALWNEYIVALMGLRASDLQGGLILSDAYDANMQASLCAKLVKADFSGARVQVIKASNTCMVGVGGIVIRETPRSFVVI